MINPCGIYCDDVPLFGEGFNSKWNALQAMQINILKFFCTHVNWEPIYINKQL